MARGILRCGYCKSISLMPGYASVDELLARPVESMPKGMKEEESSGSVVIVRRWFSGAYVLLAVFCLVWTLAFFVWYPDVLGRPRPGIGALFPLAHAVAGIVVIYATIAGFLNSTWIKATDEEVSITHGPLPWPGQVRIKTSEIRQLYCKERVNRSDRDSAVYFEVWVGRHDGTAKKLFGGILFEAQAIYIEQRIEAALCINDCPVKGELRR